MAKPLTGPLAFQNKIAAVIKRRDVRVENRAERFFVGGLNRRLQRFSEREFFAQAFVNQDARVDGKADR